MLNSKHIEQQMKKIIISIILTLLSIGALILSGCEQTDYPSILNKKDVSRFYFGTDANKELSLDIEAEIDGKEINALMPHGTDLTVLTPSFDLTGYAFYVDGELQTSGETAESFESSRIYSLYSYDGFKEDYTVSVTETVAYFTTFSLTKAYNTALSENIDAVICGNAVWFYLPHVYNLSSINPSFVTYLDGPAIYNEATIVSGGASYSFESPLIFRVYEATESDDREYMDYQVSAYRLTNLSFTGDLNNFDQDYRAPLADDTITVELPSGTDLSRLKPTYSYLGKSITFNGASVESGSDTVDFSSPVSVVVDTESGVSHSYTVHVVLADDPQNESETTVAPSDGSGTGYGVTYYANGADSGSVPVDSSSYNAGSSVTVMANSGNLAKADCYFGEWNTKSDGSGTSYTEGNTLIMPASNLSLYAIWNANPTHTITFDDNESTYGTVPSAQLCQEGCSITLPDKNDLVGPETGKTYITERFLGWSEDAGATTAEYESGDVYAIGSADVTLYAVWTGGTGLFGKVGPGGGYIFEFTGDTYYECAPEYLEGVWGTSGLVVNGITNDAVDYGKLNTVLIAHTDTGANAAQKCLDYSRTHNGQVVNDWFLPTYLELFTIDDNLDTSSNIFDVLDRETNCWTSNQDSSATSTKAKYATLYSTGGMTKSTILKILPVRIMDSSTGDPVYVVSYFPNNDFTVPVDNNFYLTGEKATIDSTTTYTKTGYSFYGWNTKEDGSGTHYDPGAELTIANENVILYAEWIKTTIETAEDFYNIRKHLDEDYTLADDIDLSAYSNWEPISQFKGTLDGNGHTITNLYIDGSNSRQGLFSYNYGSISNIVVKGATINGSQYIGTIAGNNHGTISSCYIDNCNVSGTTCIGTLVGYNYGTISQCCAVGGSVSGSSSGGLIGFSYGGSVENCFATVPVAGGNRCGGLIGYLSDTATIINSYAAGAVSGTSILGGLIGMYDSGTVTGCYYDIYTTGYYDAVSLGGGSWTLQGEGKETTDMQGTSLYQNNSWDTDDIWSCSASGYPVLYFTLLPPFQ